MRIIDLVMLEEKVKIFSWDTLEAMSMSDRAPVSTTKQTHLSLSHLVFEWRSQYKKKKKQKTKNQGQVKSQKEKDHTYRGVHSMSSKRSHELECLTPFHSFCFPKTQSSQVQS